jgi:8-oxo-dGTP diphosphatase
MSLSTLSNSALHAVKAIIYRGDSHVLLQQRDCAPGLLFPGLWTLFGGQVEAGENLTSALQRELIEELGCVPGEVRDELFQWEWPGVYPVQNHYFPVLCEVNDDALDLLEGQAMSWFPIEVLQDLALTPDVRATLAQLTHFVGRSTGDQSGRR